MDDAMKTAAEMGSAKLPAMSVGTNARESEPEAEGRCEWCEACGNCVVGRASDRDV
jgi:hypothetical protein